MYKADKNMKRGAVQNGTYWLDEKKGEWFKVVDANSYADEFVLVITWIEDENGEMLNAHKELVPWQKFRQLAMA